MWWWDSNPLPRERESSMTATRPGLLPKNYLVSFPFNFAIPNLSVLLYFK